MTRRAQGRCRPGSLPTRAPGSDDVFAYRLFSRRSYPPELEREYQKDIDQGKVRTTWTVNILGSLIVLVLGLLDLWTLPSSFLEGWMIRLAIIAVLVAVNVVIRFRRAWFLRHYREIYIGEFLWCGSCMLAMMWIATPTETAASNYFVGLIMVVVTSYSFSSLSVRESLLIGVPLLVGFAVIAVGRYGLAADYTWPVAMANICDLVAANAIPALALDMREHYLRSNFELNRRVLADKEELLAAKGEAELLAQTDSLTGVLNRRAVLEHAQGEFVRARRFGHAMSLLMIDADHFKRINDTHGHQAGDEALRSLTSIIRTNLRDVDMLGRIGGEEFVVVLVETSLNQAMDTAERIRRAIASRDIPLRYGGIHLTASLGVVSLADADRELKDLMSRADSALYLAKEGGRNRSVAV
ncbi:MAG TPA: GGDEF domain-containing protein [bacterium]